MKNKKNLKNRLTAGIMSIAMLASASSAAAVSIPVSAADKDYAEALALSLYMFDANACGTDVDEGPLTWRGDCHTYDGKAAISAAQNFDSSAKSLVDPDGDGYVDVSGGYHDAGDHVKFNLTMAFGAMSLAMSDYLFPDAYDKAGARDHMKYILKRTADYLMKTTFLDGSGNVATICYTVSDDSDHSYWESPEKQTYARPTYWLTASQNNSAVCGDMAAALAGTAYVFKDSDPTYSAQCLKYAKAVYDFGSKYSGNYTGGMGSMYGTDSTATDDLALAQAWLWINGEASKPTLTPSQGQYNGNYDYHYYCWNKVWGGYSALMYKATGDSVFSTELKFALNQKGGVSTSKYNLTDQASWGGSRYNCILQMYALLAADGNANSDLAQGAKYQMNYILGDNPFNYSFLVGYGDKWPTKIHHRAANPGSGQKGAAENSDAIYTAYGLLVGGPDGNGEYRDQEDQYQWTEGALDYNGSFALAAAGLVSIYGGTDKGAAKIVSGASEVKYPFSFGSGSDPLPSESESTSESGETTTSKKETTTTQKPDPIETTTTQKVVTGEKTASVTEKTNEDGAKYWTVDVTGGQKLTMTMKTNSNDTETNGCFNPPGGWNPTDWTATPNGGTFTVTYTIPAGQTSVDFYVWWPTTTTLVSATLTTAETVPPETTTSTSKTTTTSTSKKEEQTTTTQTTPSKTKPGDADENGKVNILDVIAMNRAIMGREKLSDQGLANVDFNHNGKPESEEALSVLKLIVGLITENDLIG